MSPSGPPASRPWVSSTQVAYRLSHPLGEWVIETGKNSTTPVALVTFDVSHYTAKLSMVEAIKGQSGWLNLQRLCIDSFDKEEHMLFSAFTDSGKSLDQETCEKLFNCSATVKPLEGIAGEDKDRLVVESKLASLNGSRAEIRQKS